MGLRSRRSSRTNPACTPTGFVPEHGLPRRIDAREAALGINDHDQIQRQREEPVDVAAHGHDPPGAASRSGELQPPPPCIDISRPALGCQLTLMAAIVLPMTSETTYLGS